MREADKTGGSKPTGIPNQYSRMKHSSSISSASEFTSVSQQQQYHSQYVPPDRLSVHSLRVGNMQQLPRDVSGSRASFQNALDNPCEYFIDVM